MIFSKKPYIENLGAYCEKISKASNSDTGYTNFPNDFDPVRKHIQVEASPAACYIRYLEPYCGIRQETKLLKREIQTNLALPLAPRKSRLP